MRNSTIKIKTHKKCLNCQEKFRLNRSTDVLCSMKCYNEYNDPKKIEERFGECKKAVKGDSTAVFGTLQDLINTIVRLIDRGHPCISSGLPFGKYHVNAGHFYGVGSNPALRYHLLNIFNQSKKDNDEFGGNGSVYGLGLKNTFGEEIRNEIEGLVAKYPRLGLTKLEAKEKCKIAGQIIKELKDVEMFSTEYRIEVRRKLNQRIGIYK